MNIAEKLLLKLDVFPLGAVYRSAIGFCFVWIFHLVLGAKASPALFLVCLVMVLLALRVGPALFRRVLRFSPEAKEQWALRRYWAKLYDSYQWQKLLWIGVGLAAGAAWARRTQTYEMAVAGFCVVTGALGLILWQARKKQLEVAEAQ